MSKKARFKKAKKQAALPPGALGPSGLKPQTIVSILETNKEPHYYKSFNSKQATIKKLAKNSGLPSEDFYTLKKEGKVSRNTITLIVQDFEQELWNALEKESK